MVDKQRKGGRAIITLVILGGFTGGLIQNEKVLIDFTKNNLPALTTAVAGLILLGTIVGPAIAPTLAYLLNPRSFDKAKKEDKAERDQ